MGNALCPSCEETRGSEPPKPVNDEKNRSRGAFSGLAPCERRKYVRVAFCGWRGLLYPQPIQARARTVQRQLSIGTAVVLTLRSKRLARLTNAVASSVELTPEAVTSVLLQRSAC